MAYVSHDKTLRNQGSWSLAGIWNHSWSATACDTRDRSNIFACLQDFFLTGATDELLLQPSLWVTSASLGCQMTEEGGFAHASRTHSIFVNEQQEPALLRKEILNALIYSCHETVSMKGWGFPAALSWHMSSTAFSRLRTSLNCKGKCYSWGWKSAAAPEWFFVPQTLQWPDWLKQWRMISSSLNPVYHGRILRQVGQGGGRHVAGSGLRW